mgnify:CR=1 FL=1
MKGCAIGGLPKNVGERLDSLTKTSYSPPMSKRTFIAEQAQISIIHRQEPDDPSGHFDDNESLEWVIEQDRAGNEWAWCALCVQVKWAGFTGEDYLGACSYKSFEDFKSCDYFGDMVSEAMDDLLAQIEQAGWEVEVPKDARKVLLNQATKITDFEHKGWH